MDWTKIGLVFSPQGRFPWMQTHAMAPCVDPLDDGRFAVYFSSRDRQGRARIGRFDFDPCDPFDSVQVYNEPCLDLGELGTFDDAGVNAPSIVNYCGRKYLYYAGWNLGVTVPFYAVIGVAASDDSGKTFHRLSQAPVIGRDHSDPYMTSSPFVSIENGVWRMWYLSGVRWQMEGENPKPKHYYHIKYAESRDGLNWGANRYVCIDFKSPDEYAIARPCVIRAATGYQMWYCYRGSSYRVGYAESTDGISWRRDDDSAGISPSPEGWDSEMIAYPFVFSSARAQFMLYNGNAYGKDGIGLARENADARHEVNP